MKKLEALIQPFQHEVVIDALRRQGVDEIVASEVLGSGLSQLRSYRGIAYTADYRPRIKLEMVVGDDCVTSTVDAIVEALRTERGDDASVSVTSVQTSVDSTHRLRTDIDRVL